MLTRLPRRSIRMKLLIAFLALLGLMVAVTVLSLRTSHEARFLLERSRLAHAVLEDYHALRADTLALFKQLVDTFIVGAGDPADDQARLTLRERVSHVREAIIAELAFVAQTEERESEADELGSVVEIEDEIRRITTAIDSIKGLVGEGRWADASPALARILDERVDGRLAGLLQAAIDEEEREVAEADRLARTALWRSERLTVLAALLAVVIGLVILVMVQRQVRRPFERLLAGTAALSRGEFDHRLPVANGDELSQLAASFNTMADRVAAGRTQLEASRSVLEEAVSARTEDLRRANEALKRVDMVRRRFFADISHELRTPLTVIRGESEIALRGKEKSGDDYRVALQRVLEQARSLGLLVDDLLFVARADAGAARLNRQTVNLGSLLRGVCRDGVVLGREAGVAVEYREHVSETALVGDPGRLHQLFLILVDNAVRYSRPGGRITLDLSPAPRGLLVRVADEGVGIPPEEVDTVFERFRRGANAPSQTGHGSGLGLPVAKAIVEAHGGEIRIESELDHGTVVTVLLPANGKLRAIA